MNRANYLLFLIITLVIGACSPKIVRPDLVLQEVALTGVSFSSIDLGFIVKITNPNSTGVKIEELIYQLDLNGVSIGSGEISKPITIEASQSQLVTLPFSTQITGISQLFKMILGENEVNYKIRGEVVLSKFWIKHKFSFENAGVVPLNRSTFHH